MSANPQRWNNTDPPWVLDSCITLDRQLPLESGTKLEHARIAYRLIGDRALPLVLVLGGISASRRAWCAADETGTGWWQQQIGPRFGIDTDRYCVLAVDYLGGNGETESPRLWADKACQFPAITTVDQALLICRLLEALEINILESVVGASYGGMVAQQLALMVPACRSCARS